jgi:hypothetical protein
LVERVFDRGVSILAEQLPDPKGVFAWVHHPKLRIKCVNEKCTAPEGIFEFDEHDLGTSGPTDPKDPNAREFIVKCPFCGTMNSIWLKTKEHSISYSMDVTIVKDTPLDFK